MGAWAVWLRGLRLAMGLVIAAAAAAMAQTPSDGRVLVVGDDRGGLIRERAREIRALRAAGTRVQIRGRICLSTCTMFLGLPETCVAPGTLFGFHGPSRYGTALSRADFDYWSRVVANHYPEPLRSWYVHKGRRKLNGHYRVSGAQLIALGIPACG